MKNQIGGMEGHMGKSKNSQETNAGTNAILVVDDNYLVAYVVGQLVGHMGFRAVLAANGREALDWLAVEEFIAVISDVEMPMMDGFELAGHLRLLYPELPVLMISALFDESRRQKALSLGAKDLLEKPITEGQLVAVLSRHLPVRPIHERELVLAC